MKTKLIPFVPPEVSTIYSPPLKAFFEGSCVKIVAYIRETEYSIICEKNAYVGKLAGDFKIEVEEKPQRMTYLQLLQLLDRGGWISKSERLYIGANLGFHLNSLNEILNKDVKVSRIDKIEWIEPTTDLLEL